MTAPLFTVSGVSCLYGGKIVALDRVDLAIGEGEFLMVLGANGSGKSTLLKLLDGLVFASSGTVSAYGENLTESALESERFRSIFRSRVGFLFQNPDVQLFSATILEEVAFGPLQLGFSQEEARRRAEELLGWLGIAGLKERSPLQLSGGEKKKVAIAAVLAMNPEVLLLDEPTAALDPRSRHWFMKLAMSFREMGKTVVAATHDLAFAKRVGTRVAVMDEDHRIAAAGTPEEILSDRALLESVNLLHRDDPFSFEAT